MNFTKMFYKCDLRNAVVKKSFNVKTDLVEFKIAEIAGQTMIKVDSKKFNEFIKNFDYVCDVIPELEILKKYKLDVNASFNAIFYYENGDARVIRIGDSHKFENAIEIKFTHVVIDGVSSDKIYFII